MTTRETSNEGCILMVLVGAIGTPLIWAWKGYVLSVMWAWFAVPAFGVKPISIPVALGLTFLIYGLQPISAIPKKNEADDRGPWERIFLVMFGGFFGPVVTLGVGWLVRLFL